mgnify:FL=1
MDTRGLKKFYFHVPGAMYAYDIWAKNMRDCRQRIREFYGITRLPNNLPIWPA